MSRSKCPQELLAIVANNAKRALMAVDNEIGFYEQKESRCRILQLFAGIAKPRVEELLGETIPRSEWEKACDTPFGETFYDVGRKSGRPRANTDSILETWNSMSYSSSSCRSADDNLVFLRTSTKKEAIARVQETHGVSRATAYRTVPENLRVPRRYTDVCPICTCMCKVRVDLMKTLGIDGLELEHFATQTAARRFVEQHAHKIPAENAASVIENANPTLESYWTLLWREELVQKQQNSMQQQMKDPSVTVFLHDFASSIPVLSLRSDSKVF